LSAARDGDGRRAPWRRLRSVLVIALLCAYTAASHVAATSGAPAYAWIAWSSLVAGVALALPWRAGLAFAAVLLGPVAWIPADVLLKAPPVAIYLALGIWFGRTLLPGREPLISRFASLERGRLEPVLARYTRRLTALWSAFFVGMAIACATLAVLADGRTWSVFTNGVNYLLMAVLFFGEYVYRRLRYSAFRHASLPRMIRMLVTAGRAGPRAHGR
jgi:uncharacterized membrane protein